MTDTDGELRKNLQGVDALLNHMMPEADLDHLDPKRATRAATAVGTVVLAKRLVAKSLALLNHGNGNGHVGRPRGRVKSTGTMQQRLKHEIEKRLKASGGPVKQSTLKAALHDLLGIPQSRNNFYAAVQHLRSQKLVKLVGEKPDTMLEWIGE